MNQTLSEILSQEQAGLRVNRSTIDQIFALRQIIEKYLKMNRGLYIGYIDFRKAFDSVWRKGLWRVLRRLGYEKIIKSMNEGTFSAVRLGGCLSDWFETTVSVMQGCILSPMLLNVFLEVIMSQAMADRSEGAVISDNLISNLRFTDDISTLAESNQNLQEVMSVSDESLECPAENIYKTLQSEIGLLEEKMCCRG